MHGRFSILNHPCTRPRPHPQNLDLPFRFISFPSPQADAESKYLAGQGIARQRQAIMSGLQESVTAFQTGVTEVNSRDVISLMLLTQYFDALREIGNKGSPIFM
jgi:hypothetical protein